MADPTGDADPPLTLHQLIRSGMDERGWSYSDLERHSDRALSRGRWQQLGSGVRQKAFPDPASLLVIAQVLEVDITIVVLAAAQSVGLDARLQGSSLAHLLPTGTEHLSERMRDAVLALIRAAVADTLSGHDGPDLESLRRLTLEWPKSAAPSGKRHNGATTGDESDTE